MNFSIGFIGAGKVGVSLGKYFSVNNLTISGYYSKTLNASKKAASFTYSNSFKNLKDLIQNSNLIFITTPDDVILSIWNEIKEYNLKDKIICHASGSLSSSVFSNINTLGAFGYSIHPMCAFSDKFESYKLLNKIFFSIEGDEKYLPDLIALFQAFGNNIITLDKAKKPLYHLANVTVSNLVLSLLDMGSSYLAQCNIPKEIALASLMPLIESNIKNIKTNGFIPSLTGPIERNDLNTLKHHLAVLPAAHSSIYKDLSLNLINLSEKKHPKEDFSKLKNELKGE